MLKKIIYLIPFVLFSCGGKKVLEEVTSVTYEDIVAVSDTLTSYGADSLEYGESYGYKNKNGDIVFPTGTWTNCFSDSFVTFAYVVDTAAFGNKMVAINRNNKIIFEPFIYDNGPDYLSDGLFRVVRNGLIGYADPTGKIIIEPIYKCAYPFEGGKAKVAIDCKTVEVDSEHTSWESDAWMTIDKSGNRL